ncbi:hypothetical protein BDZ89DRAFT_1062413 [Hymenopellis radicata]|nr:hypothetical protein BDZ89DRAFT_1062413 [Hymenopellis radicata]
MTTMKPPPPYRLPYHTTTTTPTPTPDATMPTTMLDATTTTTTTTPRSTTTTTFYPDRHRFRTAIHPQAFIGGAAYEIAHRCWKTRDAGVDTRASQRNGHAC